MSVLTARPITGVPIGGTPMRGRALGGSMSTQEWVRAILEDGNQSAYYPTPHDSSCHLWRHYQQSDLYEMWVPHGDNGRYAVLAYNVWSTGIWGAGRLREGVVATHVPHNDPSVVRTGGGGTSSHVDVYGGSASWVGATDATLSCTVTGTTLGLRVWMNTNCGFALVAIDGDYTAATSLPVVTSGDVSAGYFVAGDIGKRYISSYGQSDSFEKRDFHILLAEGLSPGGHTITVKATGTKLSVSSDTRVNIAAFVGATGAQLPGDAGTAMFYTVQLSGRMQGTLSAMDSAYVISLSGDANYEWVGGNHGNETLTSRSLLVDGATQTLAANEILSGTSVEILRDIVWRHTLSVPDIAQKLDSVVANVSTPVSFKYTSTITFETAVDVYVAYSGMMPSSIPESTLIARPGVDRMAVGVLGNVDIIGVDGSYVNAPALTVCAHSTSHDTVFILAMSGTSNVNDWVDSADLYTFIDRSATNVKGYFTLVASGNTRSVSSSEVISAQFGWRVMNIPAAASVIESLTG